MSDYNDGEYDDELNDDQSVPDEEYISHDKIENDDPNTKPLPVGAPESFEASCEKEDASEVFNSKKGYALNRKLLLAVVAIAVSLALLAVIIVPNIKKKKKPHAQVPTATEKYVPDFEGYVMQPESERSAPPAASKTDDEIIRDLNERMSYPNDFPPPQPQPGVGGGGYSPPARPDTSNNYVQKSIQGIKGLTPTGRQTSLSGMPHIPPAQTAYSGVPQGSSQLAAAMPQLPDKAHYIQQLLALQGMKGGLTQPQAQETQTQNDITHVRFLDDICLTQGSVIPAVLVTGINTDLPGTVIARVTKNIYSSISGRHLLIPQGTLLYAQYSTSVAYAQNRVEIAWTTMIRPDGLYVELGSMPAVDEYGYAGAKGKVNNHIWEHIKAFALITALALVNVEIKTQPAEIAQNPYVQGATDKLREPYSAITNKLVDRATNIRPTITVQPGTVITILTNTNIFFPPVAMPQVTERYVRYK